MCVGFVPDLSPARPDTAERQDGVSASVVRPDLAERQDGDVFSSLRRRPDIAETGSCTPTLQKGRAGLSAARKCRQDGFASDSRQAGQASPARPPTLRRAPPIQGAPTLPIAARTWDAADERAEVPQRDGRVAVETMVAPPRAEGGEAWCGAPRGDMAGAAGWPLEESPEAGGRRPGLEAVFGGARGSLMRRDRTKSGCRRAEVQCNP